jgi:hypothetical protein
MTRYEIKAMVDGIVIERKEVKSLAEAQKVAAEWQGDTEMADAEVAIDTIKEEVKV